MKRVFSYQDVYKSETSKKVQSFQVVLATRAVSDSAVYISMQMGFYGGQQWTALSATFIWSCHMMD